MSPLTQTLELPVPPIDPTEELLQVTPEHDALSEAFGVESTQDHGYDNSPTTISIPLVGSVSTLVVDDSVTAERSLESFLITPKRAKLALLALAVGAFAMGANETSVVALSPQIATGLGVSVETIGFLVTAFALTIVIAVLPLTMLTARLNRRVTLTGALALWTTGVVVSATAGSVVHLATGRVLAAAAHALFWAIVAPTAASLFAPHLRGRTVSRIMVGAAASGVIGTPVVTVVGRSIDWHAPFWAFAVLGVALTLAMAVMLPSAAPARADDDEDDTITLGDNGMVTDTSAPTDTGTGRGGGHRIGRRAGRGAASEASGGGVAKTRAPHSSLSRGDLPSKSAFMRVLAVTFLASTAMSSTWTYIVPFYTRQASVTSNSIPVMFALGGVLAVGATLAVAPFLIRRAVRTVAVGILTLILGWALLALAQPWSAIAAQVVLSTGWAILLAALLNWALRHTPWRTELGAATYTMTLSAGAASGPLVGAAVAAQWGLTWLPVVSLGLTFTAAVVTLGANRTMRRRLHVPRPLRMAMLEREALRARRREWRRRSEAAFEPLKWRPSSVAQAGKSAVKASKGAVKASKEAGKNAVKAAGDLGKQATQRASNTTRRSIKPPPPE